MLVIDDVEGVRQSIKIHLRGAGYQVSTAGSYTEGMMMATRQLFDVILCDLKLPDKSGVEIIKDLKEQNITTPVVAVSGFIDAAMVNSAKAAGAVAYLPKPFLKSDLLALLAGVLQVEETGRSVDG